MGEINPTKRRASEQVFKDHINFFFHLLKSKEKFHIYTSIHFQVRKLKVICIFNYYYLSVSLLFKIIL